MEWKFLLCIYQIGIDPKCNVSLTSMNTGLLSQAARNLEQLIVPHTFLTSRQVELLREDICDDVYFLCLMIYFTNHFFVWAHDHATHLPHPKTGGRDLRSDQRPRFSFASLRYLVHTSLLRGARSVILCNRKAGQGQAGEVLLVHQDVSHHEVFVQVQPVQSPGAGSSQCCSQLILTGERVYFPSS